MVKTDVKQKPARRKTKVETLREWEEGKRRSRWVVLVVFVVIVGISMVLWWRGQGRHDVFEGEPVVWESDSSKLKAQNSKLDSKNSDEISKIIDTGDLKSEIAGLVEGLQGTYVVYGEKLIANSEKVKSEEPAAHLYWEVSVGDMDEVMEAASLIKLPVMVGVYRMAERGEPFDEAQGYKDLDSVYKLRDADRVGGSGSLIGKPNGYEISIRDLIWHMGNESDNTAFAAVRHMLGDDKLRSEFLRMGLTHVSLENNEITPAEVVKLLEGMYSGSLVDEKGANEILQAMTNTWYEDRIPAGVPDGVRVAHKVGTEVGVVSDAGIVFSDNGDYLLLIMTNEVREAEAKEAVVGISKLIWQWNSSH